LTPTREATVTTLDITRSIDIHAPAEKVWAAITEPELIAQWFGDTCDFDATPGSTGTFGWPELDDPQGAHDGNTGGWKAELGELVEFVEAR
jgi:uncharacterized protein YndB with AHSA1/START domain